MIQSSTKFVPAIFISHGAGPFPLLGDPTHQPLVDLLHSARHTLDNSKGIIRFTAHWETNEPHASGAPNPGIFYDYEERPILPKEAFEFEFPTTGNSELAEEIVQHLRSSGFEAVNDKQRGWDHGVCVPMAHLRPEWDIPIVQMSILKGDNELDFTKKNFALGKAMALFREKGHTIIGSGSSSHDFHAIQKAFMRGGKLERDTHAFEDKLKRVLEMTDAKGREESLMKWRQWPATAAAHLLGHEDHFMPLLICAGSAGQERGRRFGIWDLAGTPQSCYVW